MKPTKRFTDAVGHASELHGSQLRKGTGAPYLTHLLAVAGLVLEDGGDEDEAIAGLLHDAVEDRGGRPVLDEIRARYGDRVAAIVDGCTDTYEADKPAWRPRKEAFLRGLESASRSVLLVANADKLHNARSLVTDYRELGEVLWDRFTASGEETLWYFRSLVDVFTRRRPSKLSRELARTVADLEALAGEAGR